MPDLDEQLKAWADQAEPITATEARTRADEPVIPISRARESQGLFGSPSRRLLVAAAVVLVVVGGVVAATQIGDSDEVRITEQPQQPDPTPSPDSSEPPAMSDDPMELLNLDGPIPPVDFDGAPPFWLGHDERGQLVAVDTATGRVRHVVGRFDDGSGFVPPNQPQPMVDGFLGGFGLAPDRQSAFVEVCCEPVSGTMIRMPIEGGQDSISDLIESRVSYGYSMEFSPDGTRVAIAGYENLRVVDLTSWESWVFPYDEPGVSTVAELAWSLDGGSVVAAWPYTAEDGSQMYEVRSLELGGTESFEAGLAVFRTAANVAVTDVSVDTDGNVQVATRAWTGDGFPGDSNWNGPGKITTVNPETSDWVSEVEHEGTVVSQHHGSDGTWTLLLAEDDINVRDDLDPTPASSVVSVLHDGEWVSAHFGYHNATW